ncbi:MAG: glycosyltransferase family 2 protein [Acidobacteria bacterium]|nr:glycosyltransferase family 2 protein [Acidobacteriota bacterium]
MDTPPYLSLVIPAFNESGRLLTTLQRCIARLDECVPSWEILVVDDGSRDSTRDIAMEVAGRDGRVRLIPAAHGGKGAAVRRGMLAARGRWRFFADADLSMDLSQLPDFLAAGADIAIASREAKGAQRIGEPLSRHLLGRLFNLTVRLVALPGIRDTQCGYKLFSDRAVQQLFAAARIDGFAFDVEILFLARRAGFQIREVPVTWHHRPGSRVRLRAGLAAFLQVVQIRWNDLLGRYDTAFRGAHRPA